MKLGTGHKGDGNTGEQKWTDLFFANEGKIDLSRIFPTHSTTKSAVFKADKTRNLCTERHTFILLMKMAAIC
jgi:hypothetical protein